MEIWSNRSGMHIFSSNSLPFRGGQLQRGDGADAIQMARCSGTTGDHAASLGAAQWGNGQCGDERDGEEWVTWRELVMSWMRGLSWEGGMSFVLSCLRVWSYPEWCRLLLPRYPLLYSIFFGGWREQSSPHPTKSISDLMHQWLGLVYQNSGAGRPCYFFCRIATARNWT